MIPHCRTALTAALLCVMLQAAAQSAPEPARWAAEYSTERQRLSNNTADWQEHTLRLQRTQGKRRLLAASASRQSRFGLEDDQIAAHWVHPLGERLTASLDATAASSPRFLPDGSLALLLQHEFAPAWLLHGGAKHTRYPGAVVTQQTLMLENYVGSASWALAWRPVQALGMRAASTELRVTWHYGDDHAVGVSAASGQEVVQISSSLIELHDSVALALTGHHRLNASWRLSYALSSTRLADLYDRNGLRLGVLLFF